MVENKITKRLTGAALAALLLFFACVPVPTNVYALDRLRYERAHANPGILLAGDLAYKAGVALLAGAGVMVAANTFDDWAPQSQRLVSDFVNYVNENGYYNEYNGDLSQYVDATGQNVNLQAMYNDGLYDMLLHYLNSESANEILYNGSSSASAPSNTGFNINGHMFKTCEALPYALALHTNSLAQGYLNDGYQPIGYYFDGTSGTNDRYRSMFYLFGKPAADGTFPVSLDTLSGKVYAKFIYGTNGGDFRALKISYDTLNGTFGGGGNIWSRAYEATAQYRWFEDGSGITIYQGTPIAFDGLPVQTGYIPSVFAGVYEPGLVNQRIAEIASGAVQKIHVIEPTAEQIANGITYQDAISAQLAGISTGVEGLDQTINTLIGVTSGISSWLSSTLFGQYCATVTNWLGATPFGNVMATVIDGVNDIPGHVDDAGQVVAGGIAALPGAIEGVLERTFPDSVAIPGVLEQTLTGVQAIPGSIQSVIDAVNSGVLDLTGAIEGVMEMRPQWPKWESPEGEVEAFFMPTGTTDGVQVKLEDKVPFCYVVHSQAALTNMFANFSSNRSFYFDMEIPNAGSVHFDGESVLSQNLGLTDIATTIRIALTGLLCFALLYRAYKVVEETQGSV